MRSGFLVTYVVPELVEGPRLWITLSPWIFSRVAYSGWLVVANLVYWYTNVLEYFVEFLSKVTEGNGSVVWEVLFDKYVAVEAAHFWNCENTDTTE